MALGRSRAYETPLGAIQSGQPLGAVGASGLRFGRELREAFVAEQQDLAEEEVRLRYQALQDELQLKRTLDDYFDVIHRDLDCIGCQDSYGAYDKQKATVWAMNVLAGEDQVS